MASRRDSRTDEQRQAAEDREMDFHRKRHEAGLPPLHYAVMVEITFRDVTDEQRELLNDAMWNAAFVAAEELQVEGDPLQRGPVASGGVLRTERNSYEIALSDAKGQGGH